MCVRETFGNRLRQLREEKHCKQEQIARLINMNKTAISCYENGFREPSMQTLDRLADIFGVTVDYLMGRRSDVLIDGSGLSQADLRIVIELVHSLSEKNSNIQK